MKPFKSLSYDSIVTLMPALEVNLGWVVVRSFRYATCKLRRGDK